MMDATLAWSHDDGESFRNARLSSRSFDSRVGPRATPQLPVDFGSRLGVVSADGPSVAAWTDTRRGSEETGRQDVFAAVYEVSKRPPGISHALVIAALALAGVLFALLAAASSPAGSGRSRP